MVKPCLQNQVRGKLAPSIPVEADVLRIAAGSKKLLRIDRTDTHLLKVVIFIVVLTAIPHGDFSGDGVERTGCGARVDDRFVRGAVGDHVDEGGLAIAGGAEQKDVETLPLLGGQKGH